MDRLFSSNIEDKEVLHKNYADVENVRDNPPLSNLSVISDESVNNKTTTE